MSEPVFVSPSRAYSWTPDAGFNCSGPYSTSSGYASLAALMALKGESAATIHAATKGNGEAWRASVWRLVKEARANGCTLKLIEIKPDTGVTQAWCLVRLVEPCGKVTDGAACCETDARAAFQSALQRISHR